MASQWLTVNPTAGSNDRTVSIVATENGGTEKRATTVAVTAGNLTQYVQVTQLYKPWANQIGGSYMVSGAGGKIYISVHSPYQWRFANKPGWVEISDSSGTYYGTNTKIEPTPDSGKVFTYTIAENPSREVRSYVQEILFLRKDGEAGSVLTVTITQDGKSEYITVTPTFIELDYDGGSDHINVESNTDWTVDANDE